MDKNNAYKILVRLHIQFINLYTYKITVNLFMELAHISSLLTKLSEFVGFSEACCAKSYRQLF